jgi:glutathione S-transferase
MPTLHQMHVSGNCYKVRLAARQLGVVLKLVDYGLLDGTTRQAGFLAKNPNGRVPMLELDDGRCLPESGAILWYLAEGTPLVPGDRWGRAEALQWMFFEQYSHEPCIAVARFICGWTPADSPRRADLPKLRERGHAALAVMEKHLAAHAWFSGDDYGIADIALYAYTCVAPRGFVPMPAPDAEAQALIDES